MQIRLHHGDLYNDVGFADDWMLVERAYGIPDGQSPAQAQPD